MPAKPADRVRAYAEAMLAVARAEGSTVDDELFRFARALEGSDELREALADRHLPATRRQQIVEELLGGEASTLTVALVAMVVGAGRAKDLPAIIDSFVRMQAAEAKRELAEVRSAIDLNEDQRQRLSEALSMVTGKAVDVKVVVDPTVLGGLVATIGETVIDGSVRHRLDQLRNVF